MLVREETPSDEAAIRTLVADAFRPMPFSDQTEHLIVDALRKQRALTLSLVAEDNASVVGHVAFSPVTVDGSDLGWHALGPIAVVPARRRQGIGSVLIEHGFGRLRALNSAGCVVLGDQRYYRRFGFRRDPQLTVADYPPEHFMILPLGGPAPKGIVRFHPAFAVSG
jgi:putative acetyltransferase